MNKKNVQKKQPADAQLKKPTSRRNPRQEGSSSSLIGTGVVLLAIFCVIMIIALVTQRPTPVVIPASLQQATPANGPDAFGRQPGDEHHGHAHP